MRIFGSGVSSMPRTAVLAGLVERPASSAARSATVCSQAALGTASSTSRHCTAFLPPIPSDLVAK